MVSEAMLQQTQVARVVERYRAFLRRFPNVRRLAEAREQEVLAEWRGMGYYRQARNLHAAAKMIVREFGGRVPRAKLLTWCSGWRTCRYRHRLSQRCRRVWIQPGSSGSTTSPI